MPKGVYVRTEFHRSILSYKQIGIKQSPESNAKRSTTLKGHPTPEWVRKKISEGWANRTIPYRPSDAVISNLAEYARNHTRKGTHHTEETKAKLREARLRQNPQPVKNTSIELQVRSWLDESGLLYTQQYRLDKFLYDFIVTTPTKELLVECDGTYWHSLPDMIRRGKEKDDLAKKYGFDLLRLSESSIKSGEAKNILLSKLM